MALVCFDIDLDDVGVYEENLIDFNEFENCEIEIPDDINISDLTSIKDEEEDRISCLWCRSRASRTSFFCVKCSKPYKNILICGKCIGDVFISFWLGSAD